MDWFTHFLGIIDLESLEAIWIGIIIGIGGSAGWAILCFVFRCLRIWRVRRSFTKCVEIDSGAGGVDYRSGAFIVLICNRTPWDLVIRSVSVSTQSDCSKLLPLKHEESRDIIKLNRVSIAPEWFEKWQLALPERVEPKCGIVKYESEGYFGGCVIRSVKFLPEQIQKIRKFQLSAQQGKTRLENQKG